MVILKKKAINNFFFNLSLKSYLAVKVRFVFLSVGDNCCCFVCKEFVNNMKKMLDYAEQ